MEGQCLAAAGLRGPTDGTTRATSTAVHRKPMQLCLCRIISRTVNVREGTGTTCQQLQGPGWEGAGTSNPKTHPKAGLVPQGHLRVPLHWCQGCQACVLCPLGSGTCAPTSLLLQRGAECAPHFLVGTVKLAGKFLKTIGARGRPSGSGS